MPDIDDAARWGNIRAWQTDTGRVYFKVEGGSVNGALVALWTRSEDGELEPPDGAGDLPSGNGTDVEEVILDANVDVAVPLNLYADSSGIIHARLASSTTYPADVISSEAGNVGDKIKTYRRGIIEGDLGFVQDQYGYLSPNPGEVSHTPDTTVGELSQVLGRAYSSNKFFFSVGEARINTPGGDPSPVEAHAFTHYTGGTDPLPFSKIGAAAAVHTHEIADVNTLQSTLEAQSTAISLVNQSVAVVMSVASSAQSDATSALTGLDGKADSVHTHEIADVDGLSQTIGVLSSGVTTAQSTADTASANALDALSGLATKAELVHTHTTAQITGLDTELDALEASDAALNTALDNKADINHNHDGRYEPAMIPRTTDDAGKYVTVSADASLGYTTIPVGSSDVPSLVQLSQNPNDTSVTKAPSSYALSQVSDTANQALSEAESALEEVSGKLSYVTVDGTTITGYGTPDSPLVAVGGGGGGAPAPHASTHSSTGSDPITPESIGASRLTSTQVDNKISTHNSLVTAHGQTTAGRAILTAATVVDQRTILDVPSVFEADDVVLLNHEPTQDEIDALRDGVLVVRTDINPSPDTKTVVALHAPTHATNGTDPITPRMIGAAPIVNGTVPLRFMPPEAMSGSVGWFTSADDLRAAFPTASAGSYAMVQPTSSDPSNRWSWNGTAWVDMGVATGAVSSVNGMSGDVVIDMSALGGVTSVNTQTGDAIITPANIGAATTATTDALASRATVLESAVSAQSVAFANHVTEDQAANGRWDILLSKIEATDAALDDLRQRILNATYGDPQDILADTQTDAGFTVPEGLGGKIRYTPPALILLAATVSKNGTVIDNYLLLGLVEPRETPVLAGDVITSTGMASIEFYPLVPQGA